MVRIALSVAATTGAAVSPTVAAANSAAADHSSRFRPTASSSREEVSPATMLPAANAARWSPPTE